MNHADSATRDIAFGARYLYKHPNYSVTTLLTLVLTVASVATMLTLVRQVILQPLSLPQPEQLVSLEIASVADGDRQRSESIPFATFEDWQAVKPDDLEIAWAVIESSVLTEREIGVYSAGHLVSHNFLSMLGVEPHLGRWFTAGDAGQPVLAISWDMWQQDLAGDPSIVGRTIALDKTPYTVTAVMPRGFLKSVEPRVRYWRPIDSFGRGGAVIGRLSAGSTPARVEQLRLLFDRILQRDTAGYTVGFAPLLERLLGRTGSNLWLLMGGVAALFLVAVLNLTNLTFAYLHQRMHELSTRAALGATRSRLARQLIVENLALSFVAAVASIPVTIALLELAVTLMPAGFPRREDVGLDTGVWLSSLLLAVATGALVTLTPCLKIAAQGRLIEQMQHGSRLAGLGSVRLRRHLISAQVGLALALLVAVGLLLRSYVNLLSQDLGFVPDRVVSGHIWRPDGWSDEDISRAFDRVLAEIQAVPDVSLAAAGSTIPLGPIATRVDPTTAYRFRGQPPPRQGEEARASLRTVTDDYFRVLGVPLAAGRFFDGRERTSENATLIVNRAMAELLWPNEDAVGNELILKRRAADVPYTIVGVVDNYRFEGLDAEVKPEIFLPMSREVFGGASYIARVRSENPDATMRTIAELASRLDNSMPMIELHAFDDLVADSVGDQRSVLSMLIGFAAFATLLAGVGIYGLTSYLIGCRTKEMAIRLALGAQRHQIRLLVMKDALVPAVMGIGLGLAITVAAARLLESFVFGVTTLDWISYVGAVSIVALAIVAAPIGPAVRAARLEPSHALRSE